MIDDFRINQLLADVALRELRKSPDNVARLRRGEPIAFAYLEGPLISRAIDPLSRIEDIPINSFRIMWDHVEKLLFQQGMSPWIVVNPASMTYVSEWKRVLGIERVSPIEPIPYRADPQAVNAIRRAEEYMQRSSGMAFETHATARRVVAGKRYSAVCAIASHGMSYSFASGKRLGHAMACVKGDDATITWDSAAMQRGEKWERRKR